MRHDPASGAVMVIDHEIMDMAAHLIRFTKPVGMVVRQFLMAVLDNLRIMRRPGKQGRQQPCGGQAAEHAECGLLALTLSR